jgi:hypothetical protein
MADPIPSEINVSSEVFSEVEKHYMPDVLDGVRAMAKEVASKEGRTEATYKDIFRAFEHRFASGTPAAAAPQQRQSIWQENSFLIIVVLMTVTFGLMGLLPYMLGSDLQKLGYKPDVFLDIAKLFAGVVVGGAAGVAANAAVTGRRTKG